MTEVKRRRRRVVPAGIAPSEPERDILDQYLYEVSTYPLLKGTEELDLARKIRAGDPDALQELVKRNLRFVISVAKKYQNRGLPLIDLIGEGNVGLLTPRESSIPIRASSSSRTRCGGFDRRSCRRWRVRGAPSVCR